MAKCKDIPDESFLAAMAETQRPWGTSSLWEVQNWLDHRMPFPVNVNLTRAKAGKMIKKKLIDGCACGCRGDFSVISDD